MNFKTLSMKLYISVFCCILFLSVFGQEKTINIKDTSELNINKVILISSSISTATIGGYTALYSTWYKDYPKSKFHFFNDNSEWLQMDKIGHFYTANKLSIFVSNSYQWTGLPQRKSAVIGASYGLAFQTILEIMDGYNSKWGFSWGDMTANILGSLSFLTQELFWKEQKVLLKFSTHLTDFAAIRPNVLGKTIPQRLLKDYNGQSYWISIPTNFIVKKSPDWLLLAFGYGIHNKIVGNNDIYNDPITDISYIAMREFYFSFDLDFSKLPIKNKLLKKITSQFNYLKIPFPTVQFNRNQAYFRGLYF